MQSRRYIDTVLFQHMQQHSALVPGKLTFRIYGRQRLSSGPLILTSGISCRIPSFSLLRSRDTCSKFSAFLPLPAVMPWQNRRSPAHFPFRNASRVPVRRRTEGGEYVGRDRYTAFPRPSGRESYVRWQTAHRCDSPGPESVFSKLCTASQ